MTVLTPDEYLEVNGIALATYAWDVVSYLPLWELPGARGSNVAIPYQHGQKPKRRWFDQLTVPLKMIINGGVDQDGAPYANTRAGLLANCEYLQDNLGFAVPGAIVGGVATGTVPAIWHRPDGTTKTADVQPIPPLNLADLQPDQGATDAMKATLVLLFPEGGWN